MAGVARGSITAPLLAPLLPDGTNPPAVDAIVLPVDLAVLPVLPVELAVLPVLPDSLVPVPPLPDPDVVVAGLVVEVVVGLRVVVVVGMLVLVPVAVAVAPGPFAMAVGTAAAG